MLGRFRYGLFWSGKIDVNRAYIGLEVSEKKADGKRRIKRSGKIDVNRAYIGLKRSINRGQWKGTGGRGRWMEGGDGWKEEVDG